MADHCRKQIRDAIATALVSLTTANSVHTGRVHPPESAILPAVLIFTNDETGEDVNKAKDGSRNLTVTVEAYAQGNDVVDTLDAVAAEVEPRVMTGAPIWVKDIDLTSTSVELSGEAVTPSGLIRLEFAFTYHVNPAAPDTPL